MRYFARLLSELRTVVEGTRPGDVLTPPPLLSRIDLHGRRLSYFHMGLDQGRPIILLHGFGGFFMDWPRVMAPVSRRHHVFAIDLPGWGFSEPHEHVHGIEDDVRTVHDFIRHLDLREVTLVGLSYGGGVAWASAGLRVPGVKQVVLLNPMPPHPLRFMHSKIYNGIFFLNQTRLSARLGHKLLNKQQFKVICKESIRHFRLLDSFYLELGYRVIKQPHIAEIMFRQARGARQIDWSHWERKLSEVEIPVHILQGDQDRLFSLQSAQYLQGLIPGATLEVVGDCGHAMVFDQHRHVSEFLLRLGVEADAKAVGAAR